MELLETTKVKFGKSLDIYKNIQADEEELIFKKCIMVVLIMLSEMQESHSNEIYYQMVIEELIKKQIKEAEIVTQILAWLNRQTKGKDDTEVKDIIKYILELMNEAMENEFLYKTCRTSEQLITNVKLQFDIYELLVHIKDIICPMMVMGTDECTILIQYIYKEITEDRIIEEDSIFKMCFEEFMTMNSKYINGDLKLDVDKIGTKLNEIGYFDVSEIEDFDRMSIVYHSKILSLQNIKKLVHANLNMQEWYIYYLLNKGKVMVTETRLNKDGRITLKQAMQASKITKLVDSIVLLIDTGIIRKNESLTAIDMIVIMIYRRMESIITKELSSIWMNRQTYIGLVKNIELLKQSEKTIVKNAKKSKKVKIKEKTSQKQQVKVVGQTRIGTITEVSQAEHSLWEIQENIILEGDKIIEKQNQKLRLLEQLGTLSYDSQLLIKRNVQTPLELLLLKINLVIFDFNNMTRALKLSIKQIRLIVEVMRHIGKTIIIVTDEVNRNYLESMKLRNTMKLYVKSGDHDDAVIIEYLQKTNAIVITSDGYGEFHVTSRICLKHNSLIIRKQESCPYSGIVNEVCDMRALKPKNTAKIAIYDVDKVGTKIRINMSNKLFPLDAPMKRQDTKNYFIDTDEGQYEHQVHDDLVLVNRERSGERTIQRLTITSDDERFNAFLALNPLLAIPTQRQVANYAEVKRTLLMMEKTDLEQLREISSVKRINYNQRSWIIDDKISVAYKANAVGELATSVNKKSIVTDILNDKGVEHAGQAQVTQYLLPEKKVSYIVYDEEVLAFGLIIGILSNGVYVLMDIDKSSVEDFKMQFKQMVTKDLDVKNKLIAFSLFDIRREDLNYRDVIEEAEDRDARNYKYLTKEKRIYSLIDFEQFWFVLNPIKRIFTYNLEDLDIAEAFDYVQIKSIEKDKKELRKFRVPDMNNPIKMNPLDVQEKFMMAYNLSGKSVDITIRLTKDSEIKSETIERRTVLNLIDKIWVVTKKVISETIIDVINNANDIASGRGTCLPTVYYGYEMENGEIVEEQESVILSMWLTTTAIEAVVKIYPEKTFFLTYSFASTLMSESIIEYIIDGHIGIANAHSQESIWEAEEFASMEGFMLMEFLSTLVDNFTDTVMLTGHELKEFGVDIEDEEIDQVILSGDKELSGKIVRMTKLDRDFTVTEIEKSDWKSIKYIPRDVGFIPRFEIAEEAFGAMMMTVTSLYGIYYPFFRRGLITKENFDRSVMLSAIGVNRKIVKLLIDQYKLYRAKYNNMTIDISQNSQDLHDDLIKLKGKVGMERIKHLERMSYKYSVQFLNAHVKLCENLKNKNQIINAMLNKKDHIIQISRIIGRSCNVINEYKDQWERPIKAYFARDEVLISTETKKIYYSPDEKKARVFVEQHNVTRVVKTATINDIAARMLVITSNSPTSTMYRMNQYRYQIENHSMNGTLSYVEFNNSTTQEMIKVINKIKDEWVKAKGSPLIIIAFDQFPSILKNISNRDPRATTIELPTKGDEVMYLVVPDELNYNVFKRIVVFKTKMSDDEVVDNTLKTFEKEPLYSAGSFSGHRTKKETPVPRWAPWAVGGLLLLLVSAVYRSFLVMPYVVVSSLWAKPMETPMGLLLGLTVKSKLAVALGVVATPFWWLALAGALSLLKPVLEKVWHEFMSKLEEED